MTSLADLDMEAVESVCSPAPYGDLLTESTKLDRSVRRALEAACDVKLDYSYAQADQIFEEDTFPHVSFVRALSS